MRRHTQHKYAKQLLAQESMLRFNPTAKVALSLSLDCLRDARAFVRGHASDTRLEEEQVALLEVAVIESVTNVIRHAKGVPNEGNIEISAGLEGQFFKCAIEYTGDKYAPPESLDKALDFTEFPESGFGNFIIMNSCDNVYFDYFDGKNIITFELMRKF